MSAPDRDKTAPPAAGAEPEHNRGYAENEPRDKEDARHPPVPDEDPEEGGLERKPGEDANPAA